MLNLEHAEGSYTFKYKWAYSVAFIKEVGMS